jgi:hypothetical protein
MLTPLTLEKRFLADEQPLAIDFAPPAVIVPLVRPGINHFFVVIAVIAAVAALAVIIASVRMSERSINLAVEAREAPARFLANELGALRLMALTAKSVVPARLYIGMEECFTARAPIPFNDEQLALARQTLATCADMEIGRLNAQGGAAMAAQGRQVLRQAALLQ